MNKVIPTETFKVIPIGTPSRVSFKGELQGRDVTNERTNERITHLVDKSLRKLTRTRKSDSHVIDAQSGWCIDGKHGIRCYWKPCDCPCHESDAA